MEIKETEVGKYLTLNQILANDKIMCNSNLSELDIDKNTVYVQPLTLSSIYYMPHFTENMSLSVPSVIQKQESYKKWIEYRVNSNMGKLPFMEIPAQSRILVQSNEVLYAKIKIKIHLDTRQGLVVHCEHAQNGRVNFVIFNHNPVPVKLYTFYSIASCRFYATSDLVKMDKLAFQKFVKSSDPPWSVLPDGEQANVIRVVMKNI